MSTFGWYKVAPDATVILYGSEARGDASQRSDIDLLILLNKEEVTLEDEEKITLPLYLLELKTGVLISPLIVSKKAWENRPFKTPFYLAKFGNVSDKRQLLLFSILQI